MRPYTRSTPMRVIRILAACLVAATCARDAPVAPKEPTDAVTDHLTALATALTDAQRWLLPSAGDRDVAADVIAARFTELSTSLARGESDAFAARFAAARQALGSTAGESDDQFIQRAALGLALDGIEAVLEGKLRVDPETQRPAADRSQQ